MSLRSSSICHLVVLYPNFSLKLCNFTINRTLFSVQGMQFTERCSPPTLWCRQHNRPLMLSPTAQFIPVSIRAIWPKRSLAGIYGDLIRPDKKLYKMARRSFIFLRGEHNPFIFGNVFGQLHDSFFSAASPHSHNQGEAADDLTNSTNLNGQHESGG